MHRAAWGGVPLGVALSGFALSLLWAHEQPGLVITAVAMLPLMLWLLWRHLRSAQRELMPPSPFSVLWMLGLLTTMAASLITALVSYGALMAWAPDWCYQVVDQAIAIYSTSDLPQAKDALALLHGMVENHAVPRVIDVVTLAFWTSSFAGSLASAVLAALIAARSKPRHITQL